LYRGPLSSRSGLALAGNFALVIIQARDAEERGV
jgi:hypothetical protein